jgi:hypothetical protein
MSITAPRNRDRRGPCAVCRVISAGGAIIRLPALPLWGHSEGTRTSDCPLFPMRSCMTRLVPLASAFIWTWLLCPVPILALAQDPPGDIPQENVEPPAHVAFVDGSAVLERDGRVDDSPENMPLLAGDRVRTTAGRVEIIFADGATLHLDANTTVDFQSDELVRLLEGRIRLSIPGPLRPVSYRIDAPSGWARVTQPGEYRVALMHGDRGAELELAVIRGGAELLTQNGSTELRAGERAYSRPEGTPSSVYAFNSASWDAFDRWSEARRDRRLGVSAGYLPDEVRPYAESFDRYGTWRDDPAYGRVWYPSVAADWRPYYYGRWVPMPLYGWTWVGRDNWAWPTHHYGRWGFSAGVWFWIPGRVWSPAWVSWAYAGDYVSWSPLGWDNRPLVQINVFAGRDRWHPWTVVPRRYFGTGYVSSRAVSIYGIDAGTRGSFAYRRSAPDFGGYARPRASAPIRAAGTGRALPRDSRSTVYTNLEPRDSRVGATAPRVRVGPPGTSDRSDVVRRGRVPDDGSAGRAGSARPRYETPAGGASTPSSEIAPGSASPGAGYSRRAEPRGNNDGAPAAPEAAPRQWRSRPQPRERDVTDGAIPQPRATAPSAQSQPPSYDRGARERRVPDTYQPQREARPRAGDHPAYSPGRPSGGFERRPPADSRPSGPAASGPGRTGDSGPSRAEAPQGSGGRSRAEAPRGGAGRSRAEAPQGGAGASGSRSRGGQPSSGGAVRRRGGSN